MGISNESITLIKSEIEKLKIQKTTINSEVDSLQLRINELKLKRDDVNNKIQKFQDDTKL